MSINLAKSAGFCFGVKRALKIAMEKADSGKKVYMLGDIVHNEDVVRQIQKSGIKKIKHLKQNQKGILLIRAHGASKNIFKKARRLGYKIADATCPMVKEIHEIVKRYERKNYKIIVIGDKKHDEVLGIIGQLKTKALVIETPGDSSLIIAKGRRIKKACIVVQSTQNIDNVNGILKIIRPCIKNLKLINTICQPTRKKQEEIKKIPLANGLVIIIGSKNSANTKRLYQISRSLNKKTFWIASKNELRREWFKGVKKVGITAGASTPDKTTREVIARITNELFPVCQAGGNPGAGNNNRHPCRTA